MTADSTKPTHIRVDAGAWQGQLAHNWNYIGYDEINYTYVPEGKELLAKFRDLQVKPYYVRAHHLFCTGSCHGSPKWGSTNAYLEDERGAPIYDWTFVDLTFDTLQWDGLPASRSGPASGRTQRANPPCRSGPCRSAPRRSPPRPAAVYRTSDWRPFSTSA